ncbi:hypothetical protein ElyMa_002143300 [Elysia marginata]|uniref:Protein kinase domain-containing protein n=1 Tax=Elysia marginata TaxID=1093978 RepID=A0AAV4FL01_9GAST|nr:hypothetical protein ElyMa_002143300 [Elysia marginata]
MHLYGEEHSATNDKGSECDNNKMANGGVDVRLRRQTPVSVKPPRLRLSATTTRPSSAGSTRKVNTSARSISVELQGSSWSACTKSSDASSSDNKNNNNAGDARAGNSLNETAANVVQHKSRSRSVSKISGSSSCGRRIKGRASRAGITSSTFTPTVSSVEARSGLGLGSTESLSKSVATGLSRSCENVRTAVFSAATFESGRPLIHHQRHNLKNRFQLLKTLGEGTYGKVKLAVEKSSGEQHGLSTRKHIKAVAIPCMTLNLATHPVDSGWCCVCLSVCHHQQGGGQDLSALRRSVLGFVRYEGVTPGADSTTSNLAFT